MTVFLNKLSIKLRILNIPNSTSDRTFLSEISFCDDTLDLQDILRLVDTKLKFLDIPSDTPYTVIHHSDVQSSSGQVHTSDRFVVDDGYLPLLLQKLFPDLSQDHPDVLDAQDGTAHEHRHFLDDHVSVSQLPGRFNNHDDDGLSSAPLARTPQKQRRASVVFDVELSKRSLIESSSPPPLPITALSTSTFPSTSSGSGNLPKRTIVPLSLSALNALANQAPIPDPVSLVSPPPQQQLSSSPSSPLSTSSALTLQAATELAVQQMEARGTNFYLLSEPVGLVILSMRVKRSSTILEVDFCDRVVGPSSRITATSFDADQVRTLSSQLQANGTEVAELRHIVLARKTEKDRQFETNDHPFQLRLTARTTIQITTLLGTPMLATRHQLVVTDLQRPAVRSISALGGLEASRANTSMYSRTLLPPSDVLPGRNNSGSTSSGGGGGGGSTLPPQHYSMNVVSRPLPTAPPAQATTTGNSALTVARMGVPSLGSGMTSHGSVSSGASGSSRGSYATAGGAAGATTSLSSTMSSSVKSGAGSRTPSNMVLPYEEPGVRTVTNQDVRQRDVQLERSDQAVEASKQKIRHRQPLSTKCAICEFDGESPAVSLEVLHDRLKRHPRRGGKSIYLPTFEEVMNAVSDKRSLYQVLSSNPMQVTSTASGATAPPPVRYYCKVRVADLLTKTLHVVHPRCAHICTPYQRAQVALEDLSFHKSMAQCDLCGMTGATVACYHPECKEQYHSLCAVFSMGYVNFGIRDPALPCPSCPRHVQVFNLLDKLPLMTRNHNNSNNSKGPPSKRPRGGVEEGGLQLMLEEDRSGSSVWMRSGDVDEDGDEGDHILFDSAIVEKGDLRDPDDE